MAFNNTFTAVVGATYTAAQYNTYVRDNFTAIWVGTTAGDLEYYTSSTAKSRLAIGGSGSVLYSNGSAPVWSATGSNYRVLRLTTGVPGWADVMQFCIVDRSSSQSFGSGTDTTILWNEETSDGNGWHSLVSNTDRITPIDAGWYIPFVQIYWNRDSGGSGTMHLTSYVSKNGVKTANQVTVYEEIDANTKRFMYGGIPVQTVATDYFTVNFTQDSGNSGNIVGLGAFYSAFALLRVA